MDLASNATAVFLVLIGLCIVLQIITLTLMIRMGSVLKSIVAQQHAQARSQRSEKQGRDKRDQRRSRKQPQSPKANNTASPQQNAQANSVDKSLREINLRLKSAERDQEKARQKLQDNPNKKSRRGGSRRRRNRTQDNQGQDWKSNDRPNHEKKTDSSDTQPTNGKPSGERWEEESQQSPQSPNRPETVTEEQVTVAEAVESNKTEDASFEHGRKFAVKRRALNVDSDTEEPRNGQASDSDQVQEQETTEKEISFGRR
ncbi:MAG: hypothetical protein GF344_18160 [Chitinivibrionales bacterium]|nr:hypothetical protein [Chitinivibrionales bacterium]MBD3358582.1 hypothetical protein [Chitinivibrionales bacterium]